MRKYNLIIFKYFLKKNNLYSLFLKNYIKHPGKSLNQIKSLDLFLSYSFYWKESEEGFLFWQRVNNQWIRFKKEIAILLQFKKLTSFIHLKQKEYVNPIVEKFLIEYSIVYKFIFNTLPLSNQLKKHIVMWFLNKENKKDIIYEWIFFLSIYYPKLHNVWTEFYEYKG